MNFYKINKEMTATPTGKQPGHDYGYFIWGANSALRGCSLRIPASSCFSI